MESVAQVDSSTTRPVIYGGLFGWRRVFFRRWGLTCGEVHVTSQRSSLRQPFSLAECQVTNAQYEMFDPAHRELRGRLGFSRDDDEAVVFVSWHDAVAYCRWLSGREDAEFRLPTEAEWEYACRAGFSTPFASGDEPPPGVEKNQRRTWFPDQWRSTGENVVPLHVGRTTPNPWRLFDMHGNVEEWCLDWYGPYPDRDASDPAGPREGDFRVTRGGSHSTETYYLRSANRAGAVPEERNWLIGFRVVCADYPVPARPARKAPVELHGNNVLQTTVPETAGTDAAPLFRGPVRYVHIPPGSYGPLFSRHNHDPAICQCPNGDLLAIWYSCVEEPGRELSILASRLRNGSASWEPASVFWDAPDRNDHAPALLCAGWRLYHFNGMSAAATWGPLKTILRTSDDSGATWSRARFITGEHGPRQMPIASAFALGDGTLVLPCDAVSMGHGGTALWMSGDGGATWRDAGGTIAGIHGSAVELGDGRLLAFGRGDEVDGTLTMSVSADRGNTWNTPRVRFRPSAGRSGWCSNACLEPAAPARIRFCSYPSPMRRPNRTTRSPSRTPAARGESPACTVLCPSTMVRAGRFAAWSATTDRTASSKHWMEPRASWAPGTPR